MTNTYILVLLEEDELKINKQKGKKGTSRKIKIYAQKKKENVYSILSLAYISTTAETSSFL